MGSNSCGRGGVSKRFRLKAERVFGFRVNGGENPSSPDGLPSSGPALAAMPGWIGFGVL